MWLLQQSDSIVSTSRKNEIAHTIKHRIIKHNMTPYYEHYEPILKSYIQFSTDELNELNQQNDKILQLIEQKIVDAKEQGGDTEYRDALLLRANHYADIGDKTKSLDNYELTYDKTVGSSSKIDIVMALVRISFAFSDIKLMKKYISRVKELLELGGDWERKNLLQIYESYYYIYIREFNKSSKLLLSSIATFTCYELISYQQFVLYTVISSVICESRQIIYKQVLHTPEILQSIDDIPYLRQAITSLYESQYKRYFESLLGLESTILQDPLLSQHINWIIREARIVAYQQYLLSYRSVTLSSMANTFGISVEFLDKELFRFIGSGRLIAKIDRVSGIIETVKADTKNRLYGEMIQHGDALLNRIQKLTKVFSY